MTATGRALHLCLLSQEYPPYTAWGGIGVHAAAGAPRHERLDGVEVYRVGASIARKRVAGRTLDRVLHARAVRRQVLALDRRGPFDVIESPEAAFDGEALAGDPRFARRLVVQCHGSNARGEPGAGLLRRLHAADWAWSLRRERRLLARARVVVAPSRAMARLLAGVHGLDPDVIHVVPHGVDVGRFHPARHPERPLTIGFVARLEERKGVQVLWEVIERAAEIGPLRVRIRGALHPALAAATRRRLAAHAALVEHEGPQPHDTMPAFYQSIDVLLQPSHFESFGLAYAEAMACGAIVIAGRGGAGPEIVTDGRDGFVVDPARDADRVVEILRRLAASPAERAALSAAARAAIVERFPLERAVEAKMRVYAHVAEGA